MLIAIGSDNPDKVFVASQDQDLVYDLRRIPGVNNRNFVTLLTTKGTNNTDHTRQDCNQ